MKDAVIRKIEKALADLNFPNPGILLQIPKNPEHGDLSANIAMLLAKDLKRNPIGIADDIARSLRNLDPAGYFESIDIAPPGFLNLKIRKSIFSDQLKTIVEKGSVFGRSDSNRGKTALVEFVSANPTGPLTVGHGRGAMLGDTAANILEWNGYSVQREYYFNNAGRQMRVLGESVYSRYLEAIGVPVDFPEDGYQGEYIREIAETIKSRYGKDLAENKESPVFRAEAEAFIFEGIKTSMARLGLEFDSFFNEQQLYDNKAIFKLVDVLKKKDLIYEQEDATWFKGTAVGRDADKVLIKSTGEPTYRLPDMAYHMDKFERGFDLIVDVFGADHIDTYPDVIAVLQIMGCDTDRLRVLIHQFVTILKDGEQVKMSTRKANFITLDDLINEVGSDVVRYFFIMRGMSTHLNFDLDLAKDESDENPVFYLQYAHARVCNILKRADAFELNSDKTTDLSLLTDDSEMKLIQMLLEFPQVIERTGETLEPQQVANYLQELAGMFHRFYAHHRVINEDEKLTAARLVLTKAMQVVLANGLKILGISAPERM